MGRWGPPAGSRPLIRLRSADVRPGAIAALAILRVNQLSDNRCQPFSSWFVRMHCKLLLAMAPRVARYYRGLTVVTHRRVAWNASARPAVRPRSLSERLRAEPRRAAASCWCRAHWARSGRCTPTGGPAAVVAGVACRHVHTGCSHAAHSRRWLAWIRLFADDDATGSAGCRSRRF